MIRLLERIAIDQDKLKINSLGELVLLGYTDSAKVTKFNIYFQLSGQKAGSTSLSLERQLCVFNIPGFPGTYL